MNNLVEPGKDLRRRSLHEELTQTLRDLIVHGKLPPGVKIPEKDLCDAYSVSRTPLREALKVLANEGLIQLEPNRGARVTAITLQDLDEIFPVMGALEGLAGELACINISANELKKLQALHARMLVEYRENDLESYFASNQKIHEGILAAAKNPTLSSHYRSLSARLQRARYVANTTPARWSAAVAEHEQIMKYLAARDGQKLGDTLRLHLENKLAAIRQYLLRKN
ncbi:GntR family transcriptional regulator [Paracoccus onubensis]|uniref:GntR family transcriptional regulator n=1 Tax=Paracoccus onubensis TaxID=1675788 RepID=A0A418SNP4_9RHOB|nr:GntR family transcriptional regulator [Paracoccus onubensis]RJE82555.1 GntR family transcriptional regulator [Paracoccus onubensis]